jgi:hypothetical protein
MNHGLTMSEKSHFVVVIIEQEDILQKWKHDKLNTQFTLTSL